MKQSAKHLQRTLAILIMTGCVAATVQSQVTLQVGGGLGLVIPAGDFGGSTVDYYSGTKYGLSSGFNIHAKARFGLLGLRLAGGVDYSSLSNDGNAEPGQGKVEVSQKILSFKVGPEFSLSLPAIPLTPYVGANIALNRFSGETTFQGVSKVSSATYSMQSATRIGLGFSVGAIVKLSPINSLDINLSYNLMNVGGKAWEDVNPAQNQRLDSYLALNDNNDPLYSALDDKHFINNARNIHSIQVTASFLFGL